MLYRIATRSIRPIRGEFLLDVAAIRVARARRADFGWSVGPIVPPVNLRRRREAARSDQPRDTDQSHMPSFRMLQAPLRSKFDEPNQPATSDASAYGTETTTDSTGFARVAWVMVTV